MTERVKFGLIDILKGFGSKKTIPQNPEIQGNGQVVRRSTEGRVLQNPVTLMDKVVSIRNARLDQRASEIQAEEMLPGLISNIQELIKTKGPAPEILTGGPVENKSGPERFGPNETDDLGNGRRVKKFGTNVYAEIPDPLKKGVTTKVTISASQHPLEATAATAYQINVEEFDDVLLVEGPIRVKEIDGVLLTEGPKVFVVSKKWVTPAHGGLGDPESRRPARVEDMELYATVFSDLSQEGVKFAGKTPLIVNRPPRDKLLRQLYDDTREAKKVLLEVS